MMQQFGRRNLIQPKPYLGTLNPNTFESFLKGHYLFLEERLVDPSILTKLFQRKRSMFFENLVSILKSKTRIKKVFIEKASPLIEEFTLDSKTFFQSYPYRKSIDFVIHITLSKPSVDSYYRATCVDFPDEVFYIPIHAHSIYFLDAKLDLDFDFASQSIISVNFYATYHNYQLYLWHTKTKDWSKP